MTICRSRLLCRGYSFFFLYFKKLVAAIHSSIGFVCMLKGCLHVHALFIYTMYLTFISISDVLLFQRSQTLIHFKWQRHFVRKPLEVIQIFQRNHISLKQALAVTPSFKGICSPVSLITEKLQPCFLQIYCKFSEKELQQGYIIVTKFDESWVSSMYLLKDILLEFEEYCIYLRKATEALLF